MNVNSITKPFQKLSMNRLGQFSCVALGFFLPVSTALTNILAGLIVLCWLVGGDRKEKWAVALSHPLVKWIYPLVILAFMGASYSIAPLPEIRAGLSDALRLALIPLLLYYCRENKIANWTLWAFIAAMVLTLVLAYLKVYAGLPIGMKYTTGAIFKSHIKTSYFMAMAAFFIALKMKAYPQYRSWMTVCVILMIYYLLCMSVGRIGYLTLVLCMGLIAWQRLGLRGLLGGIILGLVLVMTAYHTSSLFAQRINLLSHDMDYYHQGGDLLQSSLGSRITFATSSLELMAHRPLSGYGTGSFGTAYNKLYEGRHTLLTDNPHNEYLRMGVEFGVLGIAALLLLFIQQWLLSRRLPAETRYAWEGVLLSFALGCALNSWIKDFTEAYFYCLMTAVCFAHLPRQQRVPKAVGPTELVRG